jgi:poly(glycerol-phosphate) alpha-glucosyltransferase
MRIGLLTMSISREGGGAMWAVRSLARSLTRAGCHVHVFSGEDTFTQADLRHWRGVKVKTMTRYGPSFFGYMPALYSALRDAELDLLHTHGLWMYPSIAALRWQRKNERPLVISPHGMLDPWALRNSAWKKRLAAILYENAHLQTAACLHALCLSEYEAVRGYGLRNPVAVIPNGVDLPDGCHNPLSPDWAASLPADSRVLLFLSRIHPKKGLINLLKAFAHVKRGSASAAQPWQLVIAGWDEGGHQKELERLSGTLGLGESIHFVGPQFDQRKAASLSRADAFILPSLSEGLPMAVLEAWSYRVPVLMTPQCNLPEGFATKAAIEMGSEVMNISVALDKLFNMTELERRTMGDRGRKLVEDRFTWPMVAASMRTVYSWILGQEAKPDFILTA